MKELTQRLGMRRLKTVTLDDFKDYQRTRREQVGEGAINLELRILRNTLIEANCWRAIEQHYKPLREPESNVGKALTMAELAHLEKIAAPKDAWQVAYLAENLAANTGMRGIEVKRLQLGAVALENRRIQIQRKATKSNAGQRLIELNHAALAAVTKLYVRARQLGASESLPISFCRPISAVTPRARTR